MSFPQTVSAFLIAAGVAASASVASAADATRIAELKKQIMSISQANQTNRDNLEDVRSQLDPLVNELLASAPVKTEAEKKPLVAGGWRYLWADQQFPPFLDFTQIYQVVSAKGFYYNISRQEVIPGFVLTGLLRGKFEDAGSNLNIEFTGNAIAPGWFAAGTDLATIGDEVEDGTITSYQVPGPVGVTGTLTNAYVDNELRVITGSDYSQTNTLFIMVKAPTIQAN